MTTCAWLVALLVVLGSIAVAEVVLRERRVREQRKAWRALRPPPQQSGEEDEQWASRVAHK